MCVDIRFDFGSPFVKTSVLPAIGILPGQICDLRTRSGSDDLLFDAGNSDDSPRQSNATAITCYEFGSSTPKRRQDPAVYGSDIQWAQEKATVEEQSLSSALALPAARWKTCGLLALLQNWRISASALSKGKKKKTSTEPSHNPNDGYASFGASCRNVAPVQTKKSSSITRPLMQAAMASPTAGTNKLCIQEYTSVPRMFGASFPPIVSFVGCRPPIYLILDHETRHGCIFE